jgi:heterotetrameric sarcosine oxidase gamma subunit
MTAIPPLQSIHKKGLFGNHYKKNENDLLNISEVKDLTIIQIVHYKNSKNQLKDINIDDLQLSSQTLKVTSNRDTRILWSAPNTWLVLSKKENILQSIKKNCSDENFAITDISHSRAVIQISGIEAKEVLKKGCPINISELQENSCVGSVFHGITIVIDFVDKKSQKFYLLTLRSFGESLYHHTTDASLEFGYIGI